MSVPPLRRAAAPLVVLAAAVLAVVAWNGATTASPEGGYDARAHIDYARILRDEGRLPTEEESYEFATPPAYAWLAVQLERAVEEVGPTAQDAVDRLSGTGARLAWLAIVAAAIVLLSRFRRGRPAWLAGLVLAALAVAAALARVAATAAETDWTAGQFLSIAWLTIFLAGSWLLAREVWPDRPELAALAALVTGGIPVVLRLGVMFHPEMQFAALAVVALVLVVRGHRRGWPLPHGAGAGLALGLAALTRPTAALVMVVLGVAVGLGGRRRALPFLAAGAVVALVVAAPWWARQIDRYGNPLESNLDRYILEGGQPRAFYVSFPVEDLVLRPYRPHFAGELWPQFHADLWSDWFGAQHEFWGEPPEGATRVLLSTQSVLGLVAAILAVGGLVAFGAPALARVTRDPGAATRDFAFATFLALAVASWVAFVVQLVRFPQEGGDPIKASYMLYLAPVFAISAVAAGRRLWLRGTAWRVGLACFGALWAASYAGYLVIAYP